MGPALRIAAEEAPVSAIVAVETPRRYPPEIENAVYFCCLEALQNVSKHAGEGAAVHVIVAERDDVLTFDVSDNGSGFDPDDSPAGAGLTNIRDRVAAAGGRVTIESVPVQGTRVSATIPLNPHVATTEDT